MDISIACSAAVLAAPSRGVESCWLLLAGGPAGHLLLIIVVAGWWLVGAVGCEDDDKINLKR